MSNWPREISPPDRIKYLIGARHDFKTEVAWARDPQTKAIVSATPQEEYLLIEPDGQGWYQAWCYIGDEEKDLGLFETDSEARKALTDFVVVRWAVRQAWEDVAT